MMHAADPRRSISGYPLTQEQIPIVDYAGQLLVIQARAGCGKTSTLVDLTANNPHERFLYLAYNRSIRDDATGRFPSNVTCLTSHQLAYKVYGARYRHKLRGNLRLRDIAEAVGTSDWGLASDILGTLNRFMCSASLQFGPEHFPVGDNPSEDVRHRQGVVLEQAERIWLRMCDVNDSFDACHDLYVKRYQMQPEDLSQRFSAILIDEAQDVTPVLEDIVLSQRNCRIIACGDSKQAVYGFRNAKDSLRSPRLRNAETLYLTHSFRFGPRIAATANAILNLAGEKVPVVGLGPADTVVPAKAFSLRHAPTSDIAFVARTVMGVLQAALFFSKRGLRLHLVGGAEGYNVGLLEDLHRLATKRRNEIRDRRLLVEFKSWGAYREMAEQSDDTEMLRAVKIIDAHKNLDHSLQTLKGALTERPEDAQLIITTAHRSKGLEFGTVYLLDDFPDVLDPEMEAEDREAEVNLLYVAATRAKRLLAANKQLGKVLRHARVPGWEHSSTTGRPLTTA